MGLHQKRDVELSLLVARQWIKDGGQLHRSSPLHPLPTQTFPFPERFIERCWKITSLPPMDSWVKKQADWVYCPAETYLPIRKKPVAITIHDIEAFEEDLPWSRTKAHRQFRAKWAVWIGKALKNMNLIFTVSEFSRQRMIKLLQADPQKVRVVGNGIEPRFFKNGNPSATPFEFPYALVIGGLRQRKGAAEVLKVARDLEEKKSDLRIVTVGQNEDRYWRQAQDLRNIVVLDMKDDEEVANLLHHASSLLLLSYYEGFGIPPLEAMAAGVPVVVSDRASLPEIVGDAGIIVDLRKIGVITDHLLQLKEDSYHRDVLIRKGYQRVKDYTWNNCVDKVLTNFEQY